MVMRGSLLFNNNRRTAQRFRQLAISAVGSSKIKLLLCFCIAFTVLLLLSRGSTLTEWTDSGPLDRSSSPGKGYAILMNTWKRYDLLKQSIAHYAKCPGLDSIHLVWSEPDPPSDSLQIFLQHIIRKNFEVLKLLPECKGASQRNFPKLKMEASSQELQHCIDPNPLNKLKSFGAETGASISSHCSSLQQVAAQSDGKCSEKPLNGKKFLVVEDDAIVLKVTSAVLGKLGAKFEVCRNGKEAFDHVCKILSDLRKEGKALPYDYIMMDCEMPVMNGWEATRLIRKEEEQYDVHIPIIALTAHAMAGVASKIVDAGMDFHLTKPLQKDKLLDVVKSIDETMEKQ